jgi:hypothetical protein
VEPHSLGVTEEGPDALDRALEPGDGHDL